MTDEIKKYLCGNHHQYNADECKEAGICPHCWPDGYGKGKMSPNYDFGPDEIGFICCCGQCRTSINMAAFKEKWCKEEFGSFDPGPFYKEEEIRKIVEEGYDHLGVYIGYNDWKPCEEYLIKTLIEYLDEKRDKHGK